MTQLKQGNVDRTDEVIVNPTGSAALRYLRVAADGLAHEYVDAAPAGAAGLGDLTDVDAGVAATSAHFLIGQGAVYDNFPITGHVVISAGGVATLQTDAVSSSIILNSAVTAVKLSLALQASFASAGTPTVGAEASNQQLVTYQPTDLAGNNITADIGLVVEVVVHDASGVPNPSDTATIEDDGSSTVVAGAGSATAVVKQSADGTIKFFVEETGSGFRYVRLAPGPGMSRFFRHSTTQDATNSFV